MTAERAGPRRDATASFGFRPSAMLVVRRRAFYLGAAGQDARRLRLKMPDQEDGTRSRSVLHIGGRAGFLVLGFAFLVLAIIGALLPVMPTTIFLILAAWCFGRSSPRLEAWMLDHPRFGGVLRGWRAHGAIPRRAKWMASSGIALGYFLFLVSTAPSLLLAVVVALAMLGCALWIVTRPEGPTTQPDISE
jgi:uncharacterized membrane protein YbaN (DUF454 family)